MVEERHALVRREGQPGDSGIETLDPDIWKDRVNEI
jgi:hypothetical protein